MARTRGWRSTKAKIRSAAALADCKRVNTLASLRTGSAMAASSTYRLSIASGSSGADASLIPHTDVSRVSTR